MLGESLSASLSELRGRSPFLRPAASRPTISGNLSDSHFQETPMPVKPIPDGYHTATPYLIVSGAAEAIEFYKKAFGATELFRMAGPDGKIGHAEIKIGNSPIMLADEFPEMGAKSAKTLGGSPMFLMLYVDNVDTLAAQAVAAGAKAIRPIQNQFYGDRSGTFEDPFGFWWTISTHVEDVPPEEIKRRSDEAMKDKSC